MKKNSSVETAQESQATNNINKEKKNVPTGKVKNIADAKKRREEREKEYQNFRINSLRRRCERLKMSKEDTEAAVNKLIAQLKEPAFYQILIIFNKNDVKMAQEALKNNKINATVIGDYYTWIEGDSEVLKKLREIMPPRCKIHPYVKKKPPILEPPKKENKVKPLRSKAEKKKAATEAKNARKKANIEAHNNRKKHSAMRKAEHNKKARKAAKSKKLFTRRVEASKNKSGKTIQMTHKTPSKSLKKAHRTLKQAA